MGDMVCKRFKIIRGSLMFLPIAAVNCAYLYQGVAACSTLPRARMHSKGLCDRSWVLIKPGMGNEEMRNGK